MHDEITFIVSGIAAGELDGTVVLIVDHAGKLHHGLVALEPDERGGGIEAGDGRACSPRTGRTPFQS